MAREDCDPVTIRVIEHEGGWHEHQRWDYVIGTILALLFLLLLLIGFNACTGGSDKPPVPVPVTSTTVHSPVTTTPPTVVVVVPTTTPKTLPITR